MIALSYWATGSPPIDPELKNASCLMMKKEENLEFLIKTSKIGALGFKLTEVSKGNHVFTNIDYFYSHNYHVWIYKNDLPLTLMNRNNKKYLVSVSEKNISLMLGHAEYGEISTILALKDNKVDHLKELKISNRFGRAFVDYKHNSRNNQ